MHFRKINFGYLFLLFMIIGNCNSENKRIEGHYFYDEDDLFTSGNIVVHSYLSNDVDAAMLNDATFIDFFRDGTYLTYLHHFEYGNYQLNQDTVQLTNSTGKTWKLYFEQDTVNKETVFKYLTDDGLGAKMSFTKIENSNDDEFPFTLDNNEWRKKSEQQESTNELIDRLQNHFSYLEKYLEWCSDSKVKARFSNLPSPIKVARNGFQLKEANQSSKWCEILSETDCKTSQVLLSRYFNSGKFKWKKSKSMKVRLVDGLKQIREGLEEYREG